MMPRPRIPIGEYGEINYKEMPDGRIRARARFKCGDGTLKQVEKVRSSREQARNALKRELAKMQGMTNSGSMTANTTLAKVAAKFLAEKTATRSAGTVSTYRSAVRLINADIGNLTIYEATPERLQLFLNSVQENNGNGSAKSVRSVLSGMMGLAVRSGALRHNPVAELDRLQNKGKKGSDSIPLDKLGDFLERVECNERFQKNDEVDLFRFMICTGLRGGEALGLRWDCVDLDKKTITVEAKSVRRTGRGVVIENFPKTEASKRTIVVADSVVQLLRRRKKTMAHNSENLVFPSPVGKAREIGDVDKHLRLERDTLGCEGVDITSHSFRKTCSSILHKQGVNSKDVGDYLGHDDSHITDSVYIAKNLNSAKSAEEIALFLSDSCK